MTPSALDEYLHTHIPITRAMGVQTLFASAERVELTAPLEPNINVHGTAFGGSGATLALLAAWSVLHLRLAAEGITNRLVIQRSTIDYLLPVAGDLMAVATLDGADLDSFFATMARRGRARLSVSSELMFEGKVAGRLTGDFVAIAEQ
ncbi:MAG: YiiD C-terminal domain-containing protein [Devosia sp.]|jgi:thioesterase domain-containing protein|uniref:YiiD C-terminal domain-containing protein n=1 Tax=unclassified Devosia TaxID=196773 RepID=UPI0019EBFD1D|nr:MULTISPECIES: YiiD C-terminal domain-containing protein [unclassified Devosia]MBF0678014.1 YiiD C-terminal domain-containing protein [Devosia sp.]WEJ35144.1 thioesterase domain-containing protein [Devosia sp. SD17-2]